MELIHREREREEIDDNIDMKATSLYTTCKTKLRGPKIQLTQSNLRWEIGSEESTILFDT